MRRVEWGAVSLLASAVAAFAADAPEPALRHRAEIAIAQRAPFVVLPLDVQTYAKSEAAAPLADLRVVDAREQRVPFALLPPAASAPLESARDVALYPLPPRKPGQQWTAPFELRVSPAGAVTLKQRSGAAPAGASGGWLFDLGDDAKARADARRLELRFAAGADFTASYRLETSADLQRFAAAGSGQLLRLGGGASDALLQPRVALPPTPPRFVRLAWDEPATAPSLEGARLVVAPPAPPASDAPTRIVLRPIAADAKDSLDGRALVYDLGGSLPLAQIDLDLGPGTRVAPVALQGRAKSSEPWQPIGRHAYWQLDRDGSVSRSEPLDVTTRARYVRVVGDERAAKLDPATVQLVVQAPLVRIVFALQGEPPFALRAGAAKVERAGALPIGSLVPDLAAERARFGSATLGTWSEVPEVAAQLRSEQRHAELRPVALWGVLAVGVALLGWMAWRMTRKSAG